MDSTKDLLALNRTKLANQRTLLAYVRTSFYFVGLGLTILGIESFAQLKFLALPSFIISLIVVIIGVVRYKREGQKMAVIEDQLLYKK